MNTEDIEGEIVNTERRECYMHALKCPDCRIEKIPPQSQRQIPGAVLNIHLCEAGMDIRRLTDNLLLLSGVNMTCDLIPDKERVIEYAAYQTLPIMEEDLTSFGQFEYLD